MSARRRVGFAFLFCLAAVGSAALTTPPADAGVRSPGPPAGIDPLRCDVALSGQGAPCQFRFHPSGTADELAVSITLRDAFDIPVPNCSTSVTLVPIGSETFHFCTCCGEKQIGFSDAAGTLQVTWNRIGGFGSLDVRVTAHCAGDIEISREAFGYTSSDLTGNCASGDPDVDVMDVALWARGMPPEFWVRSDWDCSGNPVGIADLGAWVAGLGQNCDAGGACP